MRGTKAKQLRRLRDQARAAGHQPPAKVRRLLPWLSELAWTARVQSGQVRLVRIRTGPPAPWRGLRGQSAGRPPGYQAGPSEQALRRAVRRERARQKEATAA